MEAISFDPEGELNLLVIKKASFVNHERGR